MCVCHLFTATSIYSTHSLGIVYIYNVWVYTHILHSEYTVYIVQEMYYIVYVLYIDQNLN